MSTISVIPFRGFPHPPLTGEWDLDQERGQKAERDIRNESRMQVRREAIAIRGNREGGADDEMKWP